MKRDENYYNKVVIESSSANDESADQILNNFFISLLYAWGFEQRTVEDAILDKADEINNCRDVNKAIEE